eukprot:5025194-Pleurochrysis_carterae.AAC.2
MLAGVAPALRDLDVWVGEDELADVRVEREDVDAGAERKAEKGGRRVEAVARGDEVGAGLQRRLHASHRALAFRWVALVEVVVANDALLVILLKNPKDGPSRDARVH